jgi:hypothetical protein
VGVFNGIKAKNLEFPFSGKLIAHRRINFAADKPGFFTKISRERAIANKRGGSLSSDRFFLTLKKYISEET